MPKRGRGGWVDRQRPVGAGPGAVVMGSVIVRMNRRGRVTGVAAVEFALVLPILLMIAFGIAEFARAMYEYDSLVKNVRAATRYLSTVDPSLQANRDRAICIVKAADPYATCFVPSPSTNPAPAPWLQSLTAAQVDVLWEGNSPGLQSVLTGQGSVDMVAVVLRNYQYRSFLLPFVPAVTTFDPIAASMVRLGA
ncbi:TadE/TadG family type IV pilus assembly protein [Zeimonas arvi]|nr:TadE/TadG family type IV pilus assembly protein [Zeimonas arvi]